MGKTRSKEILSKRISEAFTSFDPPKEEVLVRAVESTTKCGGCRDKIRAMILDAKEGDRIYSDLEILVKLYCTDAACGWMAEQWRPWLQSRRDEL